MGQDAPVEVFGYIYKTKWQNLKNLGAVAFGCLALFLVLTFSQATVRSLNSGLSSSILEDKRISEEQLAFRLDAKGDDFNMSTEENVVRVGPYTFGKQDIISASRDEETFR